MNRSVERLYNGIVKENPTFVLMLGMCPTLAVTSSASNGVGMGLTTAVVLVLSNLLISMLRKVIPDKVRIPAFIVIVATFVTITEMLLKAYLPSLNDSLGIYIPLIVVNCIILGRAEAYASKNPVGLSVFDGISMGIGFTIALTLIGMFRELIGSGMVFGVQILPDTVEPMAIFVKAPGAFFVVAALTALQNKLKLKSATNGNYPNSTLACRGNCSACSGDVCVDNHRKLEEAKSSQNAVRPASVAKKGAKDPKVVNVAATKTVKEAAAIEPADTVKSSKEKQSNESKREKE